MEATFDIGALEEQVQFSKSEIQLRVFKFCLFYQKKKKIVLFVSTCVCRGKMRGKG